MSKLLINEYPILILPTLAKKIGLNEAIFLQQLHYWLVDSKHVYDGHRWVYNTYENWHQQFPFWSTGTIRRIIIRLEKIGLVQTGNYNRFKLDKTKWYRIRYENLEELLGENIDLLPDRAASNLDQIDTEGKNPSVRKTELMDDASESGINSGNPSPKNQDKPNPPSVQVDKTMRTKSDHRLATLNKPIPETTSKNTPEKNPDISNQNEECNAMENPFTFFEENGFGTISSFYHEKIQSWCEELSDELVLEAMKIALENGNRNWKYAEAILRRWAEKGYQSVHEVRRDIRSFREQRERDKTRPHFANRQREHEIPPKFVLDLDAGEND